MKAEVRKKLETNELQDQVSRLFRRTKQSPAMLWVVLGLVIVVGAIYWFWSGLAANRATDAWMAYWNNRGESPEKLKGTAADRAAQLATADGSYDAGMRLLFNTPVAARDYFKKAADQYEALAKTSGSSLDITLRALMGIAKSQEALGETAKAKQSYEQVISRFGTGTYKDHPLVVESNKRFQALGTQTSDAAAFYQNWPDRLPQSSMGGRPPSATPPTMLPIGGATPPPTTPPSVPPGAPPGAPPSAPPNK
jgi:hypothetical protein